MLTLILVIVAAASYVLVRGLNEASKNRAATNQVNTRAVLKEAKAALIGYAVSYPDKHGGTKGPGRLPCPDYAYQGSSDPIGSADSCSLSAGTETGLLPFYTIGTNEMFDASGARLWYAVSDNHRANAGGVVNSDTAASLSVDDIDDVVAVIIAPGPAIKLANGQAQNRSVNDTADLYAGGEYLEGENATPGDNLFTNKRDQYANDEVITITRGELMAAVEHRVLTTVNNALNLYFRDPDGDDIDGDDPQCAVGTPDCDDAYPWLAPFANPATSSFAANVGVREGHLPLIDGDAVFTTKINWRVNSAGSYASSYPVAGDDFDPNNNCGRILNCEVVSGVITGAPVDGRLASCTRQGTDQLNCTAEELIDIGSGEQLKRQFGFEFVGNLLTPPTASNRRQLIVNLSNETIQADIDSIKITLNDIKILSDGSEQTSGTVSLALTAGDAVQLMQLSGINFDLEVDHDNKIYPAAAATGENTSPGELPAWFKADEWHHLIMVAYAAAEQPGDLTANCTPGGGCLSLLWDRAGAKPDNTLTDVRGLIIAAGPDFSASRPSANVSDYFEDQNASTGDDAFSRFDGATNFNDQLRVLDPDE